MWIFPNSDIIATMNLKFAFCLTLSRLKKRWKDMGKLLLIDYVNNLLDWILKLTGYDG